MSGVVSEQREINKNSGGNTMVWIVGGVVLLLVYLMFVNGVFEGESEGGLEGGLEGGIVDDQPVVDVDVVEYANAANDADTTSTDAAASADESAAVAVSVANDQPDNDNAKEASNVATEASDVANSASNSASANAVVANDAANTSVAARIAGDFVTARTASIVANNAAVNAAADSVTAVSAATVAGAAIGLSIFESDGVSTWISVPKDNSKQWVSGGVPVSGVDTLSACKTAASGNGRNFVAWYTKGNYNGSKCLASTRSSVPTSWSTSTRDVAMDHYYLQPEANICTGFDYLSKEDWLPGSNQTGNSLGNGWKYIDNKWKCPPTSCYSSTARHGCVIPGTPSPFQ
jgi:hypothetical protein